MGANFDGYEKAQTTKATIGLGQITVGGTDIDEQAQFADLNRDVTKRQETTKDIERGGLNANLTVDNRMLSEQGREDIANDVNATHDAVATGVDYVADEIAVLGNDLPEELRASLGDNGEDFYDSLIRGDLSSDEREAIMQDPAFLNTLMAQNELDSLSSEEKANLQADFVSKIDALANQMQANKETPLTTVDEVIRSAAGQTAESDSEYTLTTIEVNSGDNNEPTVLAKAFAGMGKAKQAIMELEESNPEAAKAIRVGLGLATGGPVKEAVSYTVEKAVEVVANMSETAQQALANVGEASDYVLNLAGSFIKDITLDEFKGELADEKQYPESFSTENGVALLGESPTDIKDGFALTASTLGIGAGLLGVKKASSHGGPDNNVTTQTASNSTQPWKYENRADVTQRTADDVNSVDFDNGYKPPYKPGTQVTEFTVKSDDKFVRVHGEDNAARPWMMRKEAVEGLTAEQIQRKYSLPSKPQFMSDVDVPAGTRMRTGKVETNFELQGGGGNGATQYEWLDTRVPPTAISNTRKLD